jgi:hypothetical protein
VLPGSGRYKLQRAYAVTVVEPVKETPVAAATAVQVLAALG